jgi:hypothetical protein
MVGASRCIAATLFKFGGPETLPQATPSLCVLTSRSLLLLLVPARINASIFATCKAIRSNTNKFRAKSENEFLRLREVADGVRAHVQGREATALLAADA